MNFGIVGSLGLLSNQFHLIICVLIIFTKTDFMAENPVDVSDLKSRLPSTVPESVIRSTLVKVSTVSVPTISCHTTCNTTSFIFCPPNYVSVKAIKRNVLTL